MAYVFNKEISTTDLLNAYNNNVVEFYMDDVSPAVYCDIRINTSTYKIAPSPSGIFTFNFKDAFKSIVNDANFADDITLEINPANADTLVVADSNGFVSVVVFFNVTLQNGLKFKSSRSYNVLLSVDNFGDHNLRVMDLNASDFYLLSPFKNILDRKITLTYWEGYPFDIGYFHANTLDRKIWIADANDNLLLNIQIPFTSKVGRFTICDSYTEITEHIPIYEGLNYIHITNLADLDSYKIILKKKPFKKGIYVKYMNRLGKWNYFLFNQNDRTELKTKTLGSINNDFNDLGDVNSPILQLGKKSNKIVKAHAKRVAADEMFVLQGLFESPKVYLYIGHSGLSEVIPFPVNKEFIEVKLLDSNHIIDDYKHNTFNVNCTFELPQRNTLTIW